LHKNANSKSGLRFCCKAHKDQAQRIGGIEAIQPAHYRGKTQSTDYRQFAFQHLPYQCNRCQYADKRILVVHHKDRDRTNNNLSNLEILCPNCHAIEHWFPNTK
jgi:5-methylcytosine-specific restriction endonuclease McrA